MKRFALLFCLLTLLGGCNSDEPQATSSPTPRIEVPAAELDKSALVLTDLGEGWRNAEDASPVTLQIGGKVGPSNIKDAENDVTTAFEQTDDTGYVSNSIFVVDSTDIAQQWIDEHADARSTQNWSQERQDGGGSRYTYKGEVANVPALGDGMFSATIDAVVKDADGKETPRKIEYVVYRIDRIVAFVVAQDAGASEFARKQEQKVATLVS